MRRLTGRDTQSKACASQMAVYMGCREQDPDDQYLAAPVEVESFFCNLFLDIVDGVLAYNYHLVHLVAHL